MIPYELIITSASRPHLLGPTLTSLLAHVDQAPALVWIHDDVPPDYSGGSGPSAVRDVVNAAVGANSVRCGIAQTAPPVGLGGALYWLLDRGKGGYVLYSPEDFVE